MAQISADKLIIGASLIFFVGIFVFAIIFKALVLVGSVENTIGILVGSDPTRVAYYTQIFQLLPWVLGFMYLLFVGGVIYIVLIRGKKEEQPAEEFGLFAGEETAEVEETFEDIFYRQQ
ncbi:Uncharacterised protein [Candidatus Tiddalikarchaeum anstoanum]|nr:Uncharacterised protein [Candidatus Tiddalikarchaeum anstoanum]